MKYLFTLLSTLALSMIPVFASTTDKDKDGHVLVSLWKTYYNAENADKPKDQIAALDKIKAEAKRRNLPWDFYEASSRAVDVRSSMNWKDREEAQKKSDAELEAFASPVLHFFRHMHDGDIVDYVKANKERLLSEKNEEFYKHDWTIQGKKFFPALLEDVISNDYEYAVWNLFLADRDTVLCRGHYGESYPAVALMDYVVATRVTSGIKPVPVRPLTVRLGNAVLASDGNPSVRPDQTEIENLYGKDDKTVPKLLDYCKQYEGTAAALLAREDLLRKRLSVLIGKQQPPVQISREECEKMALALYGDCKAFEADRARFSGKEKHIADCCNDVKELIKCLTGKNIGFKVKDGTLTVALCNLPSVDVKLSENGKTVWKTTLVNEVKSFFARDTLTVSLPVTDDGDYMVECSNGKVKASSDYRIYTLSLATRNDSKGLSAYVADYLTGEPLKSCDFVVYDNSGKVVARSGNIAMDGFTRLPEVITSKAKGWRYIVQASCRGADGRLRLSRKMRLAGRDDNQQAPRSDMDYCTLITDRTIFNPGETVHFKAVLYRGYYEYKVRAGVKLTAELFDTQNNKLATKELVTNEFGSVAGDFELVRTDRNGRYVIWISEGGKRLATAGVTVDDVVLPTYTLTWEPDDSAHLPGDTIRVRGKIAAYSGHSLGAADISYEVSSYSDFREAGTLELASDGSFEIAFKAGDRDYMSYNITVKVTDGTGETLSFSTGRQSCNILPLNLQLLNAAKGQLGRSGVRIVSASAADFKVTVDGGKDYSRLKMGWTLRHGDEVVGKGKAALNEVFHVDMSALPAGLYRFTLNAEAVSSEGKTITQKDVVEFYKLTETDKALNDEVRMLFLVPEGDDIVMKVGTTCGDAWVVAELFGDGNVLLEKQLIHLKGQLGKENSLHTVRYVRRAAWPASVTLNLFCFKDGEAHRYLHTYEKKTETEKFPLSFTRFLDTTLPGHGYSFLIGTAPGVECAATVFDKSTETLSPNRWRTVTPARRGTPVVDYDFATGSVVCYGVEILDPLTSICEEEAIPFQLSRSRGAGKVMMAAKNAATADVMMMDMDAAEVAEESVAYSAASPEAPAEDGGSAGSEIVIRENFANTIAWEPFLRSDKDGRIEFSFTTADKLSTYVVQFFAHDKNMGNAVLRREMVVTLPVKVALVQPQYLIAGDRYVARATVSNSSAEAVSGKVVCRFIDGKDHKSGRTLSTSSVKVNVPAGGSAAVSFDADAPEGIADLGLLVSFVADDESFGSDAVFVNIPVNEAVQTITESHSAVLLSGADRQALLDSLRALFVNVSGADAEETVISIRRMLEEAVPERVEAKSDNVLSLTDALYSNVLAEGLGATGLNESEKDALERKILACCNSDLGFGWFEGMSSSPVITAVVLERFSSMKQRGWNPSEEMETALGNAAGYLDFVRFGNGRNRPIWCGGISLEQYLHVRSLYPEVKFKASGADAKELKDFRKAVREYLVPAKERGLNGMILAKARRIQTMRNLLASAEGKALASDWGVRFGTERRLNNSLTADVESLLQYCQPHWAGGCYYPNAVMPWRGLLESELYAHSLLCDLLAETSNTKEADGIRLWLMIQKETQQWEDDPAYIEALGSVFSGSEELLDTKVIALKATTTLPFRGIKAAGNDMSVSRHWFVKRGSGYAELKDGDVLHVGESVRAEYRIWNRENRSFVRLTAPRPAAFRPVDQLSGHYGWWIRPLRVAGWISFSPQGYRSVLSDRTQYWFDSYPEEKTTVTEEFFVTQEGVFQTPVTEVECLYAPHYRANDSGSAPLTVEP